MASLLLGPILRYVSESCATIWVETDAACTVQICGVEQRTFSYADHHYALVIIEHLEPGSTTEYQVHLDGQQHWPVAGSDQPPSRIRTVTPGGPVVVTFGSCRAAAPHNAPYTLEFAHDERGKGVDALRALGLRMLDHPPEEWPNLLVLLGDQVYADESSPVAQQRAADRTDRSKELPKGIVADFEEYTWLYHEAWTPLVERWLMSVIPSAMIFDDHDMIDDWNISESWVRDIRAKTWWPEHVIGGLVSYWIYQHIGNLSPARLAEEGMSLEVCTAFSNGMNRRATNGAAR